jgi:hypothetical protein
MAERKNTVVSRFGITNQTVRDIGTQKQLTLEDQRRHKLLNKLGICNSDINKINREQFGKFEWNCKRSGVPYHITRGGQGKKDIRRHPVNRPFRLTIFPKHS